LGSKYGSAEEHVEARTTTQVRLMWDTEDLIRRVEPNLPSPVRQRVVLGFRCAKPTDGYATYEGHRRGVRGQEGALECVLGQRFAYLRDPDGNTVALFAPL
jgi:hypothetical protein